jgi:hypothetical protein
VSSINVTGSDKVFIFRGSSFVYIIKAKALELPFFHSPEKKFLVSLDHFISALWFPSVKCDVKKCATVP